MGSGVGSELDAAMQRTPFGQRTLTLFRGFFSTVLGKNAAKKKWKPSNMPTKRSTLAPSGTHMWDLVGGVGELVDDIQAEPFSNHRPIRPVSVYHGNGGAPNGGPVNHLNPAHSTAPPQIPPANAGIDGYGRAHNAHVI